MTRQLTSRMVLITSLDKEMQAWLEQADAGTQSNTNEGTQGGRNIVTWLELQAEARQLDYLLAHADDGVIWGRRNAMLLVTSHQHFAEVSPPLRADTLQQARLFGDFAELLLWRDGDRKFHARIVMDADLPADTAREGENWRETECFDEPQMLWGNELEEEKDGFALWREGAQGLRHAIPYMPPAPQTAQRETRTSRSSAKVPPCLNARHYLAAEADEPAARVALSRLTGFVLCDTDT